MDNARRNSDEQAQRDFLMRDQEHGRFTSEEGRSFLSVSTAGEDASTEALEMTSIAEYPHPSATSTMEHTESRGQSEGRGDHSTDPAPQKIMAPTRNSRVPASLPARIRSPAARWLAESLSFLVGIGALIAITVLMARYNNNELPQWPSGINLSAVVTALATLLRSMLVQAVEPIMGHLKWSWYKSERPLHQVDTLDEATRGPWGSTKLLLSIPRWNFITFGAVLTIASLGIGTATQQAVQTYACSKPVSGQSASIPIARNASGGFRLIQNPGSANQLKMFDTAMNAAFVSGLTGQPQALPFVCPTGNCTYTDKKRSSYYTIAFDSFCSDSTSLLQQQRPLAWSTTAMYGMPGAGDGNGTGSTNYTLSGEAGSVMISYSLEAFATFRHEARWSPVVFISDFEPTGLSLSTHEESMRNASAITNAFLVPRTSPCDIDGQGSYEQDGDDVRPVAAVNTSQCPALKSNNVTSFPGSWSLNAAVCYLYPSLRQYSGQIIDGRLQEQLIGDPVPMQAGSINSEFEISYFAFLDPCVINESIYTFANYSKAPNIITILGQTGYQDYNFTGPRDCLYALPLYWDAALADSIGTVLTEPQDGECVVTGNYTDILCGNQWWLSNLYNERNSSLDSVSRFMQNIADSLTNQLRVIGTDISGQPAFVSGTAFRTEVCTRFVWEWLLYPAVLASLVALLLIAVSTIPSVRSEVPWKMSTLPLLFYGLKPDSTLEKTSELGILGEDALRNMLRGVKVVFGQTDDGWGFRKVE